MFQPYHDINREIIAKPDLMNWTAGVWEFNTHVSGVMHVFRGHIDSPSVARGLQYFSTQES